MNKCDVIREIGNYQKSRIGVFLSLRFETHMLGRELKGGFPFCPVWPDRLVSFYMERKSSQN